METRVNELISIISATLVATLLTIGYTFMIMIPRGAYIPTGHCSPRLQAVTDSCCELIRILTLSETIRQTTQKRLSHWGRRCGSGRHRRICKTPGLKRNPVAVIDDDKNKHGMKIRGSKVEGGRTNPEHSLENLHEII